MTAPYLGFSFRREANEPAPPSNAMMSIVGLCGPATKSADVSDADFTAAFPLDEPVMFTSTDRKAAMLSPTCQIGDALAGINAQLGRMQRSARVIFTRVAEGTGATDAAKLESTMSNIIGSAASRTGLHSFKYAGAHVGAYPRLVCVPGYTHQMDGTDANPVAAALPPILASYLGVAVVDAPSTDEDAAIDYRETLNSDRLILVAPGVKVLESGATVVRPASPRIVGIGVRRDFEYEGRPFRSWCNQPLYGISGPERSIEFSLTDGSLEGQDMLYHQIGSIVRGESGDDFAIADGGFVFTGMDNVGEDAIWQQYHKVRGRDFIELTALRTLRSYLGRFNLTTHTIQTVVNVVGNILNIAQAKGDILGYQCRFDPDENNPDDLRTGKIYIDARFEEAPVFRTATILSRPHRPALEATIAQLTASTILAETLA